MDAGCSVQYLSHFFHVEQVRKVGLSVVVLKQHSGACCRVGSLETSSVVC